MGICYNLILEEDFDWSYQAKTKDETLKEFEGKFGRYIQRIAEWYRVVVYDIDKASPYNEDRLKLIREYADRAYTQNDTGLGIVELELPYNKPSDQLELETMNNRRTPEEKRISEEIVRQRLLSSQNTPQTQ